MHKNLHKLHQKSYPVGGNEAELVIFFLTSQKVLPLCELSYEVANFCSTEGLLFG